MQLGSYNYFISILQTILSEILIFILHLTQKYYLELVL